MPDVETTKYPPAPVQTIQASPTGGYVSGTDCNSNGGTPLDGYDSSHGRWKAPPVCEHESLKEESMSTAQLAGLVFQSGPEVSKSVLSEPPPVIVPVSSSSSTCTRESDTFSDPEGKPVDKLNLTPLDRAVSETLNAKVSLQKTSRQGRKTQRWITSLDSGEPIRLVTGCVPILKGGKILMASASRKAEWILPKGGWEQDETMEESAVREAFEEAGVLGILGPKLTEIQYETRKSKKRRHDIEEMERKRPKEDVAAETHILASPKDNTIPPIFPLTDEALSRIRRQVQNNAPKHCDETASVASTLSTSYSHVRMTLFPLYVTKVMESWPEKGRFRRVVDIDEALEMMESRPEFKAILQEVKERGLHLKQPNEEIQ